MFIKDILINQKNSNKIAICENKTSISYKDLFLKAEFLSKSLIKESNNIGIFLPNSINYAISYFGITLADKVIVPIAIKAKRNEIISTINYCELNTILTDKKHKNILEEYIIENNLKCDVVDIENLADLSNDFKNESKLDENNTALLLHTSGSTSRPKRVQLTHKNLISNIKSNIESLDLTSEDNVLVALPMFFGYCNTAQFLTHLYLGGTVIILNGMFMSNSFFKTVEKNKVTIFTGVPSMLLMLLNSKQIDKYDISSLKHICFGGGRMPITKLNELIETFPNVNFVQTYGLTEASPRVTALLGHDSLRKIGSVGKPIPGVSVKIIDETGCTCLKNQTGEVVVSGPNIMKGYYKRDEINKEVIQNGWLHTGDLGYFDDEGYLYITGRIKNLIICGGLNIHPEEIEEVLLSCTLVKEACISSKSHDLYGEIPIAKIVLIDEIDKNYAISEISKYCANELPSNKLPQEYIIVDELPKTLTGKPLRYQR